MKNNTLLFLTGLSGSGKGYFKENILPKGLFYPLISMTTRNIRNGETDGIHYHFKSEYDFEKTNFVTYLDVNQEMRKPGDPKWLYGVSEQEFIAHKNQNLIYDVIQPKYIRQMIDWCHKNKLTFDYKILYFIQPLSGFEIASRRAGMKNDLDVRKQNTANINDFHAVDLYPDWAIINSAQKMVFGADMIDYINALSIKNGNHPMSIPSHTKIIKDSQELIR